MSPCRCPSLVEERDVPVVSFIDSRLTMSGLYTSDDDFLKFIIIIIIIVIVIVLLVLFLFLFLCIGFLF